MVCLKQIYIQKMQPVITSWRQHCISTCDNVTYSGVIYLFPFWLVNVPIFIFRVLPRALRLRFQAWWWFRFPFWYRSFLFSSSLFCEPTAEFLPATVRSNFQPLPFLSVVQIARWWATAAWSVLHFYWNWSWWWLGSEHLGLIFLMIL